MSNPQIEAEALAERVWGSANIGGADDCWLWNKGLSNKYPVIRVARKPRRVSQLVWEIMKQKPFPPRLFACHHCDTPSCINPLHIFAGTALDNVRDMNAKGRNLIVLHNRTKTHCSNGHELSPANTYLKKRPDGVRRHCRECGYENMRHYRARLREKRNAR